ncbi:hypothetical protein HanXRQr2_Chr04g0139211 [Helianthus annuus]|uniref:PHL domain-containing protein n=1 Tax=Helianthus annuus TaxID=4232 RepID=A0A9K3NQM2_HELAN|nr:hypothetical protein HanXRQr2_Chr04g0139211 [Helianthus annuus]KAJ0579192.1 hypothetical protein HanHA300_Chr04g0115311 [Helianthus annuus]KAJ0595091.1 hypothetical protein HanHA89_Chr04g0127541 [Helianthus annuus]KAJ0755778.1 hypothetical protein HanLR1_Chr04g0119681 [Helianthus annuus]KAJ0759558.1 hypothetical protein HanOQP8_Chr04g0128061 [Helianthus annuus]
MNLRRKVSRLCNKKLTGISVNVILFIFVSENGFQETPKCYTRLILSERESDGTVAMHLGDLDDVDYLEEKEEELLPTLPTTHKADLIAEQFCKLVCHLIHYNVFFRCGKTGGSVTACFMHVL